MNIKTQDINASNNRTKQVSKVVLRDNVLKNVIHAELYKTFREICNKRYHEVEKKYFDKKSIEFMYNKISACYYTDKRVAIILEKNNLQDTYLDIMRKNLDENSVADLFGKNCPNEILNFVKKGKTFEGGHWIGFGEYSYCVEEERYAKWNDDDSIQVGVVDISPVNFKKAILSQKYEILTDDTFKKAVAIIKEKSILSTDDKSKCLTEQEINKLIYILNIDREKVKKEVTDRVMNNFTMSSEIISLYTESLLNCDKVRADLEVYEKKRLEDVNEGHWELWSNSEPVAEEGQVVVTLEKPLVARNPVIDIHEDGLIGIDFGTKSTIVSKQDGREKTNLLRVGTGQLNKKAISSHYENPTIMEFINLEKFIADYRQT